MLKPTRRQFALGVLAVGLAGSGLVRAAVRPDLYTCEGCEAVEERARAEMEHELDLPTGGDAGEAMLIEGVVRDPAGVPAADVVLYVHHTNSEGLYANGAPGTEWSSRHGRLRGWVKTDAAGMYRIRTIKPAPYPTRTMPAHVHVYVGEPGRRPYYIDDIVFDGEFGVDETYRARQELRGGSGIVTLTRPEGRWLARRDIALEPHPD